MGGERPNLGRTHENLEHTHSTDTPHHNTAQHNNNNNNDTPHNTTGDPAQGAPWPQKQDMSNKLSRRAAPLAKVFWVIKKKLSGPRGGLGQKWCGPKVVRAKSGQTKIKYKKNPSTLHRKPKIKYNKIHAKNHQNQKKRRKNSLLSPSLTKKSKNQQQNQKLKKCQKKEN